MAIENPSFLVDSEELPEIEARAVERNIGFVSAGPGPIVDPETGVTITVVPEDKALIHLDMDITADARA